ncbi:MAG: AAA family ATPase [Solirubrobacterales bacterium]
MSRRARPKRAKPSSNGTGSHEEARKREWVWEPRKPPLGLEEFSTRHLPPPKYAVNRVWAEGASGIIGGAPKKAKSTTAVELAISLGAGTPFLGVPEFKASGAGKVTYVHAENSEHRVERDINRTLEDRGLGLTVPVLDGWGDVLGYQFEPQWDPEREPDIQILSHPGMNLLDNDHYPWALDYAMGRDYLILDPGYLLAAFNPNDTGSVLELNSRLVTIQKDADCAVIITHQETEKHSDGDGASRLLGSTFLHGWYEAAIFTNRTPTDFFTFTCDNLREIGEEHRIYAQGLGIGRWQYTGSAQGATDKEGKASPVKAEKATRLDRLRALLEKHADWTESQFAAELGVTDRTVRNYLKELQPGKAEK